MAITENSELARLRIGFGYDSHRVDPERPLVLGGIEFPGIPGLKGHSDADVLTHAIIDAILSAAGEPDIGQKFPNSDPKFKGISSLELLRLSVPPGCKILQVGATVICDNPRISDYKSKIIDKLRTVLPLHTTLSVKGKSSEGLGFPGRGEGMVAFAVALILKEPTGETV